MFPVMHQDNIPWWVKCIKFWVIPVLLLLWGQSSWRSLPACRCQGSGSPGRPSLVPSAGRKWRSSGCDAVSAFLGPQNLLSFRVLVGTSCMVDLSWTIIHIIRDLFPCLYSLRRHRLVGIRIPSINPRRSSDPLRFIMGIAMPVRRRLFGEQMIWLYLSKVLSGQIITLHK